MTEEAELLEEAERLYHYDATHHAKCKLAVGLLDASVRRRMGHGLSHEQMMVALKASSLALVVSLKAEAEGCGAFRGYSLNLKVFCAPGMLCERCSTASSDD